MELNKIYNGTCLEVMRAFKDASIDCVITSPPYWQLRDYGFAEQWGLEPTFDGYLQHLWEFMDEVWRVLKPTGTVGINLGDTYNGNKKGNTSNIGYGKFEVVDTFQKQKQIPDKCLLLIPHRFAIGCIDRGWVMRNDIIWAKRNAMPESVTDRFSKRHEYLFFMAKQKNYYFDLPGIRDKHSSASFKRFQSGWHGNEDRGYIHGPQNNIRTMMNDPEKRLAVLAKGKNPGSVSDFWDLPTSASKSNTHYATFGPSLIEKCIVAGCPEDGIVLDPFCGTATTGVRAVSLGRKFIGIEGSEKFHAEATKRLLGATATPQLFTDINHDI